MSNRIECLVQLAAALLLGSLADPALAQRRPAPRFTVSHEAKPPRYSPGSLSDDTARAPTNAALLGGAIAGGALGAAVGTGIGHVAGGDRLCGDDTCGFIYGLYGFALGEAIGLPLGVHLAGGRRGNYALELVAATAVGALVAIPAAKVGWRAVAFAVPVSQLITAAAIETHGGH